MCSGWNRDEYSRPLQSNESSLRLSCGAKDGTVSSWPRAGERSREGGSSESSHPMLVNVSEGREDSLLPGGEASGRRYVGAENAGELGRSVCRVGVKGEAVGSRAREAYVGDGKQVVARDASGRLRGEAEEGERSEKMES